MARTTRLSLPDVLSHLSYAQARKLVDPHGQALLRMEGASAIDIDAQVRMDRHSFTLDLGEAVATLRLGDAAHGRIHFSCTACATPCEHVGAAFSLILEEKLSLGLAAAPRESIPLEMLSESELVERALADRAERARTESMTLTPLDGKGTWSDYSVTSGLSGKTYRVALRGWERGESYCSCPDFKTNTLGTCKHLLFALAAVKRKLPRGKMPRPYRRARITLHVRYGEEAELRLLVPDDLPRDAEAVAAPLRGKPISNLADLMKRMRQLGRLGHPVHVYPDAEEMTNALLTRERLDATVAAIRGDPRTHRLRKALRHFLSIETVPWHLIILDEGQRIKNWQAKTAQVVESLRSPFALVLTGTPLENRLDELYSVVQFINNRQLGPAFRFFHRHRTVDEKGRVLGYKNLDELKRKLEVLVGLKPPAPVDESEKLHVESEAVSQQRRERVAMAGGELLAAAFSFVRQAMGGGGAAEPDASTQALKSVLSECMERAEDGGWRMMVRFRDDSAIEALAEVLAGISARSPGHVKVQ